MQTVRNVDTGAWRVPSNHKRMAALAKMLGIEMRPTYSSVESVRVKKNAAGSKPAKAGMSLSDEAIQGEQRVTSAICKEISTGYLGSFGGQQRTYYAGDDVSEYLVPVKEGMRAFCMRLKKIATATTRVQIVTDCQVRKINNSRTPGSGFTVSAVRRTAGRMSDLSIRCKKVVLACQPFNYPDNNFKEHLEPVLAATGTFSLCHVYVDVKNRRLPPMHRITVDRLGQVIAVSPGRLMVYAGGRLAEYHNNAGTHHKKKYRAELQGALRAHLPGISIGNVKVCYWQRAVSFWERNAAGRPLMKECVIPHPTALPNLVCIGETFSLFQGWAEGALQTAEIALDYLCRQRLPFETMTTLPKNCIAFDGRVIYVKDWIKRHPGGKKAIQNHLADGDIGPVFRMVHGHAPYALAHLLSLQIGFLQKAKRAPKKARQTGSTTSTVLTRSPRTRP